jgi:hypothetical protein
LSMAAAKTAATAELLAAHSIAQNGPVGGDLVPSRQALARTGIATGDVMRCAIFQGTHNYTGASWTPHQRGVRRQIRCTSCKKKPSASKWVAVVV